RLQVSGEVCFASISHRKTSQHGYNYHYGGWVPHREGEPTGHGWLSENKNPEHAGSRPQRQRLVFINGQKTHLNDDSKPISYYGLQHGSQVSLLVTEPPPTQVFLRNEKGQTSTYDIRLDETVSNFKNRVEKREGVPASQQRLIHQGREMQGGKLEDYNVRNHSTIELTLRLRGG
uniref:ISG15 ubiquitin like modifier n=1 Tax=Maylandia zebra TaxID=106582 RepID=A0A3P9CGG2_9CICH